MEAHPHQACAGRSGSGWWGQGQEAAVLTTPPRRPVRRRWARGAQAPPGPLLPPSLSQPPSPSLSPAHTRAQDIDVAIIKATSSAFHVVPKEKHVQSE